MYPKLAAIFDEPKGEPPLAPATGSADDRLAARLVSALSVETLYKADLFDYLCWLEEKEQRNRVPGADFLCLASDGTTCWGKTYSEAVKVAMQHDKGLQDASPQNRRR